MAFAHRGYVVAYEPALHIPVELDPGLVDQCFDTSKRAGCLASSGTHRRRFLRRLRLAVATRDADQNGSQRSNRSWISGHSSQLGGFPTSCGIESFHLPTVQGSDDVEKSRYATSRKPPTNPRCSKNAFSTPKRSGNGISQKRFATNVATSVKPASHSAPIQR